MDKLCFAHVAILGHNELQENHSASWEDIMQLVVERFKFLKTCTIGRLMIDGEFFCYTLEDTVREMPGQTVEQWKVQNESAIPIGTYQVKLTMSQRFKKILPLLLAVPGFSGVRIHPGNTDKDTEGCILVGLTWDKESSRIGSSRLAFEKLMARLELANEIEIKIENHLT
jgi:hypothetical protein